MSINFHTTFRLDAFWFLSSVNYNDKDQKASGRNVVWKLINIIYQNMSNLSNLFLLF